MAQSVPLPENNNAITADTIESELYTSVNSRTTTYYDLGCKHQGLQGYFAPDRWYKTADFGDGGVDVTEAPNAKVVEGATGARLIVQTERSDVYTWRITIPADGVLFFRLEKIGSFLSQRISSTDTDLQLFHNQDVLDFEPLADGGYYSPNLKAGDAFGVSFRGAGHGYEWNDFTFYSNCIGVEIIENGGEDTITGTWKPDRVRPIPRAQIDQVFFSGQYPEQWPMLDQDGDFFTVDDQIRFEPDTGTGEMPFELDFKDRIETYEGQFWLMRRFIFREPCSGNTMSVERPWRPLPMVTIGTEEDIR
ncbi:hypothetical protein CEQ90_18940 [Lewinellaceae bacterium SD302]|nr:hypothetical protein CEQ90_18940 [Lewinellaceae bacterium SD302]